MTFDRVWKKKFLNDYWDSLREQRTVLFRTGLVPGLLEKQAEINRRKEEMKTEIYLDRTEWNKLVAQHCTHFGKDETVKNLLLKGNSFIASLGAGDVRFKLKPETNINHKFDYAGSIDAQDSGSDKDFLGWIYARLNQVFGEKPNYSYMRRLEKIIDGTDKPNEQYLKGWNDGASSNGIGESSFLFMGYTHDKLAKLIHERELSNAKQDAAKNEPIEQKRLMTREQAERELFRIGVPRDMHGDYYILNILEALGLLKFVKEEKTEQKKLSPMTRLEKLVVEYHKKNCHMANHMSLDDFNNRMLEEGLLVVEVKPEKPSSGK